MSIKLDDKAVPADFRIDPAKLQRHEGQKMDQDRAAAARERYFMQEACDYGDEIVKFASMRLVKYKPREISWGLALGTYCVRRDYPGDREEFDNIIERAGNELKLDATGLIKDPQEIERIQQSLTVFSADEEAKALEFARVYLQYIERTRKSSGISEGQTIYGIGRAFNNLRLTYPKEEGGTAAFDTYARRAGVYYQANKETL